LTLGAAVRIRSFMDAAELIAFAEGLAAAARQETLHRWAAGCAVEDKGSSVFDPVTQADREAERVMRALIRERYPDHGITGEEWPDEHGTSAYHWSLDPVDGTRSFVCRLPTWVTLIGLLHDDAPLLGLVDAPCLDETYVGFEGQATMTCRGQRTAIRTSGCTHVADARLSTTDPSLFDDASVEPFANLRRAARLARYGHDGYAYARLAAGSLDLVIENGLKPHDYNALIPLIRAAGGTIGDWRGGEDFAPGKVIAAATRALYDEAVDRFAASA
jgi:histidinol phosphatase-like enzyme (inositol monophosphatase family)